MSAPVAAEVLRELHAEARTFRTVKGTLLWYRDQLARRLRVNRDPSSAGAGSGERDDATFAAVAACLRMYHPADLDGDGLAFVPRGRASGGVWTPGESLLWLVAWYENTSDDGSDMAIESGLEIRQRRNPSAGLLAVKAGLERRAFNRRCKTIQRKLRLRLAFALLLDSNGR